MLALRDVRHLAKVVEDSPENIKLNLENVDSNYEWLLLCDPSGQRKDRTVLRATGKLRQYQDRLQRLLTRKLKPSVFNHGGVSGRSIKSNAAAHQESMFVFKTDIASFYPSITSWHVLRLFHRLQCSPEVAKLCTRICTYDHHIALGLPTSPILADQFARPLDHRIGELCRQGRLVYGRFVDDIAVSGPFDMSRNCGIPSLVEKIIRQGGLRTNGSKRETTRVDKCTITGVRIRPRSLDAKRAYVEELIRQLHDARSLANAGRFDGPFLTREQIRGRANFVVWLNPRRKSLITFYQSIDWESHEINAEARGYLRLERIALRPHPIRVACQNRSCRNSTC